MGSAKILRFANFREEERFVEPCVGLWISVFRLVVVVGLLVMSVVAVQRVIYTDDTDGTSSNSL